MFRQTCLTCGHGFDREVEHVDAKGHALPCVSCGSDQVKVENRAHTQVKPSPASIAASLSPAQKAELLQMLAPVGEEQ